MRLTRTALAAILAVSFHAVPDDAVDYYDVTGTSANEVRAAMNRLRPTVVSDGQQHDARTEWKVHWRYRSVRSGGECRLTSLDVTYDVHMTLPRWTNVASAPAEVRTRWNAYYDALVKHEAGHKQFAVDASSAIRNLEGRIAPRADCPSLGDAVTAGANAVLDQYRVKEREYDRTTNHGRNQGVHFP